MFDLPKKRMFLPPNFKVTVWSKLKPYFMELERRNVENEEQLLQWIKDLNELNSVVADDFRMRDIRAMQSIHDTRLFDAFEYAAKELQPRIDQFNFSLEEKLLEFPWLEQLEDSQYQLYIKAVKNRRELFVKENLDLLADTQIQAESFHRILANLEINFQGQSYSYAQAFAKLETLPTEERHELYVAIDKQLASKEPQLIELFEKLLAQRNKIAAQANFDNYRSYQFKVLERWDYSVEDCEVFHEAVAKELVPVVERLDELRMSALGLNQLQASDLLPPLMPASQQYIYNNEESFLAKAIERLSTIDESFGESLKMMQSNQSLDLSSSTEKHSGGFCLPMLSSGIPFISQNHNGSLQNLRQFMHLTGQAVHRMYAAHFELNSAQTLPNELLRMSGMTMKMIALENERDFFEEETGWKGFKLWELEQSLRQILLVTAIDKFQHWVYTHPNHSREMRDQSWKAILNEFSSKHMANEGSHHWKSQWQLFSHVYLAPFQFVEYGMAQIASFEIWESYLGNPKATVNKWIYAMHLGNSRSIPEIYEAAGASFDFSAKRIRAVATFVEMQCQQLMRERG